MSRRVAAVVAGAVACAALFRARRHAKAGRTGWVGRQLQDWVPGPPGPGLGRFAALLWAAPMTMAGLIAGAASGVRPRLQSGVLLFAPARGITGAVIRRRGFAATGLGHVVIATQEPTPDLLTHELVHVRQAERLGPFMAPAYLGLLAVHGYANHPMERAARLAAQRRKGAAT